MPLDRLSLARVARRAFLRWLLRYALAPFSRAALDALYVTHRALFAPILVPWDAIAEHFESVHSPLARLAWANLWLSAIQLHVPTSDIETWAQWTMRSMQEHAWLRYLSSNIRLARANPRALHALCHNLADRSIAAFSSLPSYPTPWFGLLGVAISQTWLELAERIAYVAQTFDIPPWDMMSSRSVILFVPNLLRITLPLPLVGMHGLTWLMGRENTQDHDASTPACEPPNLPTDFVLWLILCTLCSWKSYDASDNHAHLIATLRVAQQLRIADSSQNAQYDDQRWLELFTREASDAWAWCAQHAPRALIRWVLRHRFDSPRGLAPTLYTIATQYPHFAQAASHTALIGLEQMMVLASLEQRRYAHPLREAALGFQAWTHSAMQLAQTARETLIPDLQSQLALKHMRLCLHDESAWWDLWTKLKASCAQWWHLHVAPHLVQHAPRLGMHTFSSAYNELSPEQSTSSSF